MKKMILTLSCLFIAITFAPQAGHKVYGGNLTQDVEITTPCVQIKTSAPIWKRIKLEDIEIDDKSCGVPIELIQQLEKNKCAGLTISRKNGVVFDPIACERPRVYTVIWENLNYSAPIKIKIYAIINGQEILKYDKIIRARQYFLFGLTAGTYKYVVTRVDGSYKNEAVFLVDAGLLPKRATLTDMEVDLRLSSHP